MKSFNFLKSILFGLLLLVSQLNAFAQTKKPTLTVLNIDTKGFSLDAVQMGNLVRLEMERLDKYDVTDKYDINYLIEKNQLNVNNCYGKICLVEIGEKHQIEPSKQWSPELRLIGMIAMNAVIFIGTKYLFKAGSSSDILNIISGKPSMNEPKPTTQTSKQNTSTNNTRDKDAT